MRIAVIPARGGSKRIPRKNVKLFCGKPMIAWTIEAALDSGLFDHVIVSTDDDEIADVAKSLGAEVPFLRPDSLSTDETATRPVVIHAINEIVKLYGHPDYVCCAYATAAFLTPETLQQGFKALSDTGADFAFSVTSFPSPIQRALKVLPSGRVEMFNPEHKITRSQDLELAYHDAAQFYWGRTEAFLNDYPTFSTHSVPVILPRYLVQDIDTLEDWAAAEHMFKSMHKGL